MDHLKRAKHDHDAGIEAGNFELNAQGDTPWYIHMGDAGANALIALAEAQAEALEEQRKTNEILRAALDLATKVIACSHIPYPSMGDEAALDNFTEHARPITGSWPHPAGDDWPRSCEDEVE